MRIAKSSLIEPGENQLYGTVAIALSVFIFAYSTRFGQVSILAYYGLWFPLILVNYRTVLGNYTRYVWIFGFAVFCGLSIFWSAAPSVTTRTAIQYMTHVVCALIAMRTIDIRTLTRGVIAGIGLVLTYSLLFGVYHFDPIDGGFSFVGSFASKNQLGFYASLGIYFAFAAAFVLGERVLWLAPCGVVGLLAAYCLFASQSATSVLTVAVVIAISLGLRVLQILSPDKRKILFLAGTVFSIVASVGLIYGGGIDLVLGAFGKDSTLTGRTYLWQQGIEAAGTSPLFGIGYQAYWVQGFSEPERLWEEFFIGSRSGFHFHNTFIEAAVETGLIGLFLLCLILVVALLGHLGRLLSHARDPDAVVMFGVAMLLVIRAFVEIDTMTPYHVGSFLLYFTAGKLTLRQSKAEFAVFVPPTIPQRDIAAFEPAGQIEAAS